MSMGSFICSVRVIVMSVYVIFGVQGMKWCGCIGNRRSSNHIENITNPQNLDSTNHLQSPYVPGGHAYETCISIVDALPSLPWKDGTRRDDQIKNELLWKCLSRWQQLNDKITFNNPRQRLSRLSSSVTTHSVTTNLVIFKLDGAILDTRTVDTQSHPLHIIPFYNKQDLVFNALPQTSQSHDFHRERNSSHSLNDFYKLAIYRKGLMKLLFTLLSGQIMANEFEIAVFGDGEICEVIAHGLAMEMFFNVHYIKRTQIVKMNLKFASNEIPRIPPGQYHRILVVDSGQIRSRTLSRSMGEIIRIKVRPFALSSGESYFREWYEERMRKAESLERVQTLIMDISTSAPDPT